MPPTKKVHYGDKVLLFDGTIAYYGVDPISKSCIEAVYRNGTFNTYKPNTPGLVRKLFRFFFS